MNLQQLSMNFENMDKKVCIPPQALIARNTNTDESRNQYVGALRPTVSVDNLIQSFTSRHKPGKQKTSSEEERLDYALNLPFKAYEVFEEMDELYRLINQCMKQSALSRGNESQMAVKRQALYEQSFNDGVVWKDESACYSQPMSVALIGEKQSGRTSAINRCLSLNGEILWHEDSNTTQVNYLRIDCEGISSIKDLCLRFLTGIEKAISQRKYRQEVYVDRAIENQKSTILGLMSAYHVGLVVFDSFESVVQLKPKLQAEILNFVASMMGHVSTVFVLTPDSSRQLAEDEYLFRKMISNGVVEWDPLKSHLGYSCEAQQRWNYFSNQIWKQHNLKKAPLELAEDVKIVWFELCKGQIGLAVSLFSACLFEAIISEEETINVALMTRVYAKKYGLWDSEFLTKIEGEIVAKKQLSIKALAHKQDATQAVSIEAEQQLTKQGFVLYETLLSNDVDEEIAYQSCKNVYLNKPGINDLDALSAVIKESKKLAKLRVCAFRIPRKEWPKLPQGDFRQLFANKGSESFYDVLKSAGMILPTSELMKHDQFPIPLAG